MLTSARPLLLLAFSMLLAQAEDWTTVDGNVYKNVTVVSHDDGYVTIMDEDGGAKLMLTELPPDLRARFHFDPVKASACVAAEEAADEKEKDDEKRAQAAAAATSPPAAAVPAPAASAPAVAAPVLPKLSLPANTLLQNGDFSQGDSGWEGDGEVPPGGHRLLVKLSPDSWTRIFRQYQGDSGTVPSLVFIYRLSAGFAPSKDPAAYADIAKKLNVDGFETYHSTPIQPGQFYATLGDPTSGRTVYEVFNPDLQSTDVQTYQHTYPYYAADRTDTVVVAFPPGNGTIEVLGVAVTNK